MLQIIQGCMLHQVMGETVVVPTGEAAARFSGLLTLNETGTFLFRLLQTPTTSETLVAALLEEFDVTTEQAVQDVEGFLASLCETNLLKEGTE